MREAYGKQECFVCLLNDFQRERNIEKNRRLSMTFNELMDNPWVNAGISVLIFVLAAVIARVLINLIVGRIISRITIESSMPEGAHVSGELQKNPTGHP